MANDISASFAARWSKSMQAKHFRTDVFRMFASFREEAVLAKGQVVHRPYRSEITENDMGSEGQYTRQDVTDTDETLTVNTERDASFYIKDLDRLRSDYNTTDLYAGDAARALSNGIDGAVLAEVVNAGSVVDDAAFGGTSGNGVVATTSNVSDIFLAANEKLDNRNAPTEGRFAVLSPQLCKVLKAAVIARESTWGDKVGENGYMGMYDGFEIYKSNGSYSTYVLTTATLPIDGDTVTLSLPNSQGVRTTVTFTFKDILGSTAGNVLLGTADSTGQTADVARANLAALINTPGTTTTVGVALSAANQKLLKRVVATNDNTADTLTLAVIGKGYVVVGETLTAAANIWTPAKQIQWNMFGVKGCTDVVIQVKPNMKIKDRDGYVGNDIVSWNVFGLKTFAEGARHMVAVKIRADQFLAS